MTKLTDDQIKGLDRLLKPFDAAEISKLPKPTKQQTEAVKKNYKEGMRCNLCGGWHHKNVVHLDYVGHAALTKRLLEADKAWNWAPVAVNEDGTPKLDSNGGMWGYLTVCGVTRLGYGDADGKSGPNATKEVIGDFLRNAAMRFGAALDLWSKADLTGAQDEDEPKENPPQKEQQKAQEITAKYIREYIDGHVKPSEDGAYCAPGALKASWKANVLPILKNYTEQEQKDIQADYDERIAFLTEKQESK